MPCSSQDVASELKFNSLGTNESSILDVVTPHFTKIFNHMTNKTSEIIDAFSRSRIHTSSREFSFRSRPA
jgi:hypothetical protein